MIKKWQKIKTLETYRCGNFYKVVRDRVVSPGGTETDYYVVRKNPTAMVIPIDKKGNIHMTTQHRYTTGRTLPEFPGGFVDNGTDENKALQAAKRELEEETSLISNNWKYLGFFDEANGLASIVIHVFVAQDVVKINNPKKDPLDKNLHKTQIFSLVKVISMISNGEITDGCTTSTLMLGLAKGIFNKDSDLLAKSGFLWRKELE